MVSLELFIDTILSVALCVNEYQEYFLGGKGGRCVGLSSPVMGLLYLYLTT